MSGYSDDERKELRNRIMGLGENSFRKSYYPELKNRISELEALQLRYGTVIDRAPYAICIVQDERIVFINPLVEEMTGYSSERIMGSRFLDFILPEDRKHALEDYQLIIERTPGNDSLNRNPLRILRADGVIIDTEMKTASIDFEGSPALMVFIADVTRRKETERLLRQEKENLSVTLRSIRDGVITTDRDGRILLFNNVAEKLTGWPSHLARGHHLRGMLSLQDLDGQDDLTDGMIRILSAGLAVDLESHVKLRSRNGDDFLVSVSGAPIHDEGEKVSGFVLVIRDKTEQARYEEEVNRMQKIESLGLLAGGIAHDFNNILSAILGNITLARMNAANAEKTVALLADAEKAAIRARDLTQQLLTFSRGGEPVTKTSRIEDLIRESATFVVTGTSTWVTFNFEKNLYPVDVDRGQVSQVIQNLVINAHQAMPRGGEIVIDCSTRELADRNSQNLMAGTYVVISVTDKGEGIPYYNLEKIFDPYFTTKKTGTGLGLSISYSIIKRHGGIMTVDSETGKGSVFSIYLPASKSGVAEEKSPELSVTRNFTGTVMVMDDEEIIRTTSCRMLDHLGLRCITASNGEEAIGIYREQLAQDDPICCVIMDLTIPGGMGGKEAVQEILKIDPKATVVVSSGYSNDPVIARYREYGFRKVLRKPFHLDELKKIMIELGV